MWANCPKNKLKGLHLYPHVVVKTSNLVISCRCYAEYGKKFVKMRAARAARLFFSLLTNHDTVLWRCCCYSSRRRSLKGSRDNAKKQ